MDKKKRDCLGCDYLKKINDKVSFCPLPRCVRYEGWIADKEKKKNGGMKVM